MASKRTVLIGGTVAGVLVLYLLGSNKQGAAGQSSDNPTQCRVTVTADVLRVRAKPELNAPVVDRFTKGQQTDAEKLVQDGFRKIGENRWLAVEFTQPVPGRDCG